MHAGIEAPHGVRSFLNVFARSLNHSSWVVRGSVVLVLLMGGTVRAATWTVDNNLTHVADFRGLQEANDDARVSHGDIIYIAGSQTQYPDATLIKSLTLYGPGYFLGENQPRVNSFSDARIWNLSLSSDPGGPFDDPSSSAGSVVMGLNAGVIAVTVENVVIQRCSVIWTWNANIDAATGSDNLTVVQCYAKSLTRYGSGSGVLVADCYLGGLGIEPTVNGAVVQNNVFSDSMRVRTPDSTVSNNILLFTDPGSFEAAGIFRNNMLAAGASFLPAGNGNLNMVNPALVFVDTGTTDGKWQLKPGGPAVGVGVNGEDLGMFGGPTPYVLSGIPPVPNVVINANPTGTGLNGLQIHIEGHAHN